jgi:hypothetical protein
MSRNLIYQDKRLTVEGGIDHLFGNFIQIFDNNLIDDTPDGEGLVFDYDDANGTAVNLTGFHNSLGTVAIVNKYIEENKFNEDSDQDI